MVNLASSKSKQQLCKNAEYILSENKKLFNKKPI